MADDEFDDDDDGMSGDYGDGGSSGKPGFDARRIILFVVAPLFVLIGAGGGLYFSGALDKMMAPAEKSGETEHAQKKSSSKTAVFVAMPDILVNLNSEEGQLRYLRLKVEIEVASESDRAAVELIMPRVVDQFQTFLREQRVTDLRGSAGIYRLQKELLARVNAAAHPVEVQDILFQEILIQ